MFRTALCVALLAAIAPAPARAETVVCTEILSLPATLTSQGVYCLKKDVSTAVASGAAITIAANNITLDCNGYKVGGLAGGPETQATGILALARLNATVRSCNVRGFRDGIRLEGAGHVVESNRVEASTARGIVAVGDGSIVRGNLLFDIGLSADSPVGIAVSDGDVDVLDNLVSGVGGAGAFQPTGLRLEALEAGTIARNRIRRVISGQDTAIGIHVASDTARVSLRDNDLAGHLEGIGVICHGGPVLLAGNHAIGFTAGFEDCPAGAGNLASNAAP